MTRVCVLLTCHNRREKTVRCLTSLVALNPSCAFTFHLVDDGCTDGTADAVKNLKGINVHIINGNGNLFYSGGMREAITYTKNRNEKYEYYMFVNDDVEFYPNTIEKMIYISEGNIIVGCIDDGEGTLTYGGVRSCNRFRPSFRITMSENPQLTECDTFNANCVLIPKDAFLSLNNIDSYYVHGFGDYDYGLEAKKAGYHIYASNFFVGKCKRNNPAGTWSDRSLSRSARIKAKEKITGSPSKVWFYFTKKHFGVLSACVTVAYQYVRIILGK